MARSSQCVLSRPWAVDGAVLHMCLRCCPVSGCISVVGRLSMCCSYLLRNVWTSVLWSVELPLQMAPHSSLAISSTSCGSVAYEPTGCPLGPGVVRLAIRMGRGLIPVRSLCALLTWAALEVNESWAPLACLLACSSYSKALATVRARFACVRSLMLKSGWRSLVLVSMSAAARRRG